MKLYIKVINKIDELTKRAQEGENINKSYYNFMHQIKYAMMSKHIKEGGF